MLFPVLTDAIAMSAPLPPTSVSAQSLFMDGLHLVFSFLPLRSLLPAIRACRVWCDAAYKERSRGILCRCPRDLWPSVARSPLRHHIHSICGEVANFNQIRPLAALPNLTQLSVIEPQADQSWYDPSIRLPTGIEFARMWPQSLRVLSLSSPSARFARPQPRKQLLIDFVAHLPTIEDLALDFPFESYTSFDLSPLCALPRLRFLRVNAELSVPQMEHLKWLPCLERLDSPVPWTVETLSALCRPPHRLGPSLKYLRMDNAVLTQADVQELLQLPLLESIQPVVLKVSALPLLPSFQHLRSLRFGRSTNDHHKPLEIFDHLALCVTLTELELVSVNASADDLAGLLMRLPLIESLGFFQLRLPTLRCLRCAPHLRSLVLYACKNAKQENLLDLQVVASLRSLEVDLIRAETPTSVLSQHDLELQLKARMPHVPSIALRGSSPDWED